MKKLDDARSERARKTRRRAAANTLLRRELLATRKKLRETEERLGHFVTEQHYVEGALHSSEERYRAIFEQAGIGIAQVDSATGRFLEVNEKFCTTLGCTRQELLARAWSDVTHPDEIPADRAHLAALASSQCRSFTREKRYLRASGEVIWCRVTVSRLALPSSAPANIAMLEDITERKRAEEALRASEHRLAAVFKQSLAAISIVRLRDRIIIDVSDSSERLLGWSREELVGKPTRSFDLYVNPEDYERMAALVFAPGNEPIEVPVRKRSGEIGIFQATAATIEIDGALCALIQLYDITALRRADAALRESEQRLGAIFALAPVGIAVGDPTTGRWIHVNERICAITGYPAEQLCVISIWDVLVHPEERSKIAAHAQRLFRGEINEFVGETRFVRKDGLIVWVNATGTRIHEADGGVKILSVIEDITERKQSEAKLRESEEQLRAAQKMEAVGRLAGGVAHDFNNLLSVILSYTELAAADLRPEDPLLGDLSEVLKAARRAEGLTRQLLAFSRKEMLSPEPLDLNEVVEGLSNMLRRLIGEDIELSIVEGRYLYQTRADRGQIEQVIMNLCVNARDAMPDGGRLTMATANVELDAARARPLEVAPGFYVELSVADVGHGMDAAVCERIFEPFFTTKGVGKGTGLGLSMVYGIVRQSEGAIAVESAPGRGATFRVYLPRDTGRGSAPLPHASLQRPKKGHETILVVEDEPALRNVIRRVLIAAGYEVHAASGAADALHFGEAEGRGIHLILTDVIMPGMSGPELATRLGPLCPSAGVIFMSGYTDEAIERFGVIDAGFLRKPFDGRTLLERVRAALDGDSQGN